MRVALVQFNAGADKAENIRRARGMAEEALACGARFVLFPEVFNWRGNTLDAAAVQAAAERIPGPSVFPFQELARTHGACILLGSILEQALHNKVRNTSVFIAADGAVAAKYRKIHLFEARIGDNIVREKDRFIAGKRKAVVRAGAFNVGLSICYDLRFSHLYRAYGRCGVDAVAVPACFTQQTGRAHWEPLLRARAIEHLCYVLAPGQVGRDARGIVSHGNSMIVSPWGEVLARGSSDREEIVYGELSREEIVKARHTLPGIGHRAT